MRYLFIVLAFTLGLSTSLSGQTDYDISAKEYERMIENAFELDLRAVTINTLNLSKEQIIEFTPVYFEYMDEKADLIDRRMKRVEAYEAEMAEPDRAADEARESARFVEDYWSIDIDELQLRTQYFEDFTEAIPYDKAVRFFDIEEAFRSRMARAALVEVVPVMVHLEPIMIAYTTEKEQYDNWKNINIDGELALDHQFTHDGLTTLMDYADAMVTTEGIMVKNFERRKSDILKAADKLTKNWTSTEHADMTRKAFMHTAELVSDIKAEAGVYIASSQLRKLEKAASSIKADELLTNQKDAVYTFFDHAQKIMNNLSDRIATKSYQNYNLR